MPVLNRRTRILSFRLSEDEYEALLADFVSSGARSLSEYARFTLCRSLDGRKASGNDRKAQESIRKLRNHVDELDQLVRRLTLEMDSYRAPGGEPVTILRNDPAPRPLLSSPSKE